MKIVIVTDAWRPQINGVVRTLSAICAGLRDAGHEPLVISPDLFLTIPCPGYPSIRLAVGTRWKLPQLLAMARPDAVHISTEGPLGLAARRYCLRRDFRFTTAFHTRFPEYLRDRIGLSLDWGYGALRRFHAPSAAVMVASASVRAELLGRGFGRVVAWTRGVDTELFRPVPASVELPRPVFLYVGRLAVEKNLPAFLDLDLPGSKLVVGDGPMLASLRRAYPQVRFVGARHGDELVHYYSAADVLVLPSQTETFGLVILEALACGVPVAAFPAPGPVDVIGSSGCGVLSESLRDAALAALNVPREACREHALQFGWQASVEQFLANIAWL
ncbi:MAG: glycosyltransferase family 1 protein [Alphaproteobacteria bacterium]|nr:glycosyltransferase family 1 protein [Alphaproteobacteria bacterium]